MIDVRHLGVGVAGIVSVEQLKADAEENRELCRARGEFADAVQWEAIVAACGALLALHRKPKP